MKAYCDKKKKKKMFQFRGRVAKSVNFSEQRYNLLQKCEVLQSQNNESTESMGSDLVSTAEKGNEGTRLEEFEPPVNSRRKSSRPPLIETYVNKRLSKIGAIIST